MIATFPEFEVRTLDAPGMQQLRNDLVTAYEEAYADRLTERYSSADQYWDRVQKCFPRNGFTLVVGYVDGTTVGYSFGFTLPKGTPWWRGFSGILDADFFHEDDTRTFAFTELLVRPAWRRRGVARALHATLLQARQEVRATLIVRPSNVVAAAAYEAWGWYKIGQLQPFPDAPVYDSMLLDLPFKPVA